MKLFEAGSAGVDCTRSVAVDEVDDAFEITNVRARLWPQTERLKAAVSLLAVAPAEKRPALFHDATDSAQALWRHLGTPSTGRLLPARRGFC